MSMSRSLRFIYLGLALALLFSVDNVMGFDSDPLQDFCVADINNNVVVNGFVCKNPMWVTGKDFFFGGLGKPGNTNNGVGSAVTPATVQQFPGLNTLGISLARVDYAPGGINPPHTHPRATEVLVLLEGKLFVGFVTTNNTFLSYTLEKPGDVFVFPRGLVHFQQNVGKENALAIAALNSQLPGVQTIAKSLFGANPPLTDAVLSKAFQIDPKVVDYIQSKFT